MTRQHLIRAAVLAIALTLAPADAHAQRPGSGAGDGVRFGVSVGGISTVSLTAEFYRNTRSVEVSVGTWSFSSVSFSSVVRQYFLDSRVRPVVGAGFLVVRQGRQPGDTRSSWALIGRVPIGVDWSMTDSHAVGLFGNVNRGLWVRRGDPADDVPMVGRLVPLPELYYRYAR